MSQTITVRDIPKAGVRLLRNSDPLFGSSLPSDLPLSSVALLPYAVVISNDTEQEVFAYSVRWTCTAPDGKSVIQESTIYNLATLRGVLPHSRQLVPGVATLRDEKDVTTFSTFYQRQASIEISLEAVIFSDGKTVGDDTGFHIPRIKAWVDAERDLSQEIQGTTSAEALALALIKERDEGLAELSTPDMRQAGLAVAANRAPAYQNAYKLAKANFAKQMLETVQRLGFQKGVASVREMSNSKCWPLIEDNRSREK